MSRRILKSKPGVLSARTQCQMLGSQEPWQRWSTVQDELVEWGFSCCQVASSAHYGTALSMGGVTMASIAQRATEGSVEMLLLADAPFFSPLACALQILQSMSKADPSMALWCIYTLSTNPPSMNIACALITGMRYPRVDLALWFVCVYGCPRPAWFLILMGQTACTGSIAGGKPANTIVR